MGIDPKALNAIRLVKDRTSGSSRSLAGAISPDYVTLAIRQFGKHRGWIDHVVERVLCEIIGAYRIKGNKPFWAGPAYRIDRRDLSIRLMCRPRDISTALGFLEKLGFLTLCHKARFEHGEPKGTMVYAIPNIEAIDKALISAEDVVKSYLSEREDAKNAETTSTAAVHTKVTNFDTQPGEDRHSAKSKIDTQPAKHQPQSPNVPKAHNDAEAHAGRQVGQESTSSKSHLLASVGEGGKAAFAGGSTSSHTHPLSTSHDGHSAPGPTSDVRPPDSAYIEKKVNRFCYYWTEAGRRTGYVDVLAIEKRERDALREFFYDNQESTGWFAAVAIRAWEAGEHEKKKGSFDPAWACRRSKDIQSFLRLLSRILSELGANKYKVNAYRNLRWWFTDSEISKQGFPINAGLDVLEPDECWENTPEAAAYYVDNGLEPPPEVRAACTNRKEANERDQPE